FPTWEQSPYSPIAPSIRTRLERLKTLSLLSRYEPASQSKPVIVTSLQALCQCTLPVETLSKYSIHCAREASIGSREALIARLLESGYLRVDPVEDPGTFAVRGEIIDVFPPDRDQPLRIELFDDLIERIRPFDPQSQRTATGSSTETAEGLANVILPPAREVLLNAQTLPVLRENLKARADDLG